MTEVLQKNYDYLSTLGIIDKVLHNAERYAHSGMGLGRSTIVDILFWWSATDEGEEYWTDISRRMPSELNIYYSDRIRDSIYLTLLELHKHETQPQSYEYW